MTTQRETTKRRLGRRGAVVIFSLVASLLSLTAVSAVATSAAEASGGDCSGAPSANIQTAKSLYFVACGWVGWDANSGKHFCEYSNANSHWFCSGPDGGENNRCHSLFHKKDINDAKKLYKRHCGQSWNGGSGKHTCDYYPQRNSWLCSGPSSK